LRDIATDNPRNQAEINGLRGASIGHISFTPWLIGVYVVESAYFYKFSKRKIFTDFSPRLRNENHSCRFSRITAYDDVDRSFS